MYHTNLYLDSLRQVEAQLAPIRMPGTAYLRRPIVMPTVEDKQELCTAGKDLGLGVGALYPTPVSDTPELKARFQGQHYPGAATLADRLVTLPVHQYVKKQDIQNICRVLHAVIEDTPHSTKQCERRFKKGSV